MHLVATAARRIADAVRHDYLLWVLAAAAASAAASDPRAISGYPALVDWPTVEALAGLLILTQGLEASGALTALARYLVARIGDQRRMALVLIASAAVLSMIVTNDVALFALVPLTLSIAASAHLPTVRLVVFEALAVNAGSCLSPVGNPQNLFLWQRSGTSLLGFVAAMAPLCALCLATLILVTLMAFRGRPIQITAALATPIEPRTLALSAFPYVPFLVLTDLHHATIALAIIAILFTLGARRVLAHVDWSLVVVFILMFIDLRLLAAQPWIHAAIAQLGPGQPGHLYWIGIALSQLISNVPASILLAQYSHDWRTLAVAVNVGGFGIAIGSLASLIALRMLGQRRAWIAFHAWSVPFLVAIAAIVYSWLSFSH